MRKLLLTSAGITNSKIAKAFFGLVGKPASEVNVLFIPTAARMNKDPWWVRESKKQLIDLGVKHIVDFEIRKVSWNEVKDFDVMYMCGGNTYFLMKCIREANFDKIIKKFLDAGKVYVGNSAGSIVMGPDIEIAKIGKSGDKNVYGVTDSTGMNFVDVAIHPHVDERERKIAEEFGKTVKYRVKPLTDEQAILFLDGKEEFIS